MIEININKFKNEMITSEEMNDVIDISNKTRDKLSTKQIAMLIVMLISWTPELNDDHEI